MSKNYGVPYKGSKQKIAREIIDQMPPARNFYDLFAGGCAVAHAAMESGKYEHVYVNDLDWRGPTLFADAIAGRYHDDSRWISREDFARLKDTDAYVDLCWSFGNNGRNYLYAREIEPFKMRLHYLFFARSPHEARLRWRDFVHEYDHLHSDIERLTSDAQKLCADCCVEFRRNPDGTADAAGMRSDVKRVLSANIRQYLRDALRESGHTAANVDRLLGTNGMAGHYFGASQWILPTAEAYAKMQTIMPALTVPWSELNKSLESLERLERLQRLQSLESLQSLERLESLERLQSLEPPIVSTQDYRTVEILPDSVIYCDIPYKNTDEYNVDRLDYDAFYAWASAQDQPVFISEYAMPDGFCEVWRREKRCTLAAANNARLTVERLYMPRHQYQLLGELSALTM